jgi:hypothetical protein
MKSVISISVLAAGLVLAGCGPQAEAVNNAADTSDVKTCDSSMVTTSPDGLDGIAIFVASTGPDRIEVSIVDQMIRTHRLFQRVPAKSNGATFNFPEIHDGPVGVVVNSDKRGVCLLLNQPIG